MSSAPLLKMRRSRLARGRVPSSELASMCDGLNDLTKRGGIKGVTEVKLHICIIYAHEYHCFSIFKRYCATYRTIFAENAKIKAKFEVDCETKQLFLYSIPLSYVSIPF